jgi:hypothetical protein
LYSIQLFCNFLFPRRILHLPAAVEKLRLANLSQGVLVDDVMPMAALACQLQSDSSFDRCGEGGGGRGGEGEGGGGMLMAAVQLAVAYHLLPDRRQDELLPCAVFRHSQVRAQTAKGLSKSDIGRASL